MANSALPTSVSSLAPAASTSFTISFQSAELGTFNGAVIIANSDPGNSSYSFDVTTPKYPNLKFQQKNDNAEFQKMRPGLPRLYDIR